MKMIIDCVWVLEREKWWLEKIAYNKEITMWVSYVGPKRIILLASTSVQ